LSRYFFSRYFPQILSTIAANTTPELGLKLLALRLLRGARLGVRFERIADLVVDNRPVAVLVVGKERALKKRGASAMVQMRVETNQTLKIRWLSAVYSSGETA
jgi:hypothetical protein